MKYCYCLLLIIGLLPATFSQAATPSLREKIGQMLIIGFEGKSINARSPIVRAIQEDNIGGVIVFDYNYRTARFDKNIETPEQVRRLTHELQRINRHAEQTHHRPNLPLLISVDYEGGRVNRLRQEYGFPPTISAADVSKKNRKQAHQNAETMAITLQKAGFNVNFAPMLDLNVNPENPIIGQLQRSFSNHPGTVVDYADLYTQHFLNHGVQCVYKHFPGQGSGIMDSHLSFVDVSNSWQPYELEPYRQLLARDHHCGMVMSAHIINRRLDSTGLPATLSHRMLTQILRKELKFDGVIVSDDMQMLAISQYYSLPQALTLAINAGVDMLIFGNQVNKQSIHAKQVIDSIERKVKTGEIDPARIDEAYRRIVRLKREFGETSVLN